MGFVNEWVTSIVLLILLAVVLEMLLPNNALKNYVKLTVSLLLLVMLLQPLLALFHEDPEEWLYSLVQETSKEEISIEDKINSQKKEIEKFFDAYTSEQVAVQLKEQAGHELEKSHQTMIKDVAVNEAGNGEDVEIVVQIAPSDEIDDGTEVTDPIEPVTIDVGGDEQKSNELVPDDRNSDLIALLAQLWEVPESAITLMGERGDG